MIIRTNKASATFSGHGRMCGNGAVELLGKFINSLMQPDGMDSDYPHPFKRQADGWLDTLRILPSAHTDSTGSGSSGAKCELCGSTNNPLSVLPGQWFEGHQCQ
jgi:hypothetical protein